MKKISMLLAILLCLTFISCGSSEEASKEELSEESSAEIPEASVAESSAEESSEESIEEESSEEVSEVSKYLDGKKLVVFGDSITALGSWGRTAAEELNMYFFNGAMGGITSTQGIERFAAYVASQKPDYVTLLFGMNDLIMTSKNNPRTTPEQFHENMKKLVQMVIDCGATPILLTTNPYNPNTFYEVQGQDKSMYADVGKPLEWLAVYNNETKKVAEETGTALIDMYEACSGVAYSLLLSDGLHLGAKGNKIFAETLVNWFNENYEHDPNAEKISEEDTYIRVTSESGKVSVASMNASDWYTVDSSLLCVNETKLGLKFYNTNGLWPEVHGLPEGPIYISVSDGYLNFDIQNAGVSSSFILYFDGATPSAYTDGQYVTINKYFGGNCDGYTGDLKPNQSLSGSVKLSEIGIPSSCIHDGYVLITGLKIFVAGTAYQSVTLKELTVEVK